MPRPLHFEILVDDPERAVEFYGSVFGWEVAKWEGPQTYWMVTTGPAGTPGIDGGLMHRHFQQPVINTIEVASLEETIRKVEEAGGKKVSGPQEIPEVGLHAYCEDPAGVMFGILQPAERG